MVEAVERQLIEVRIRRWHLAMLFTLDASYHSTIVYMARHPGPGDPSSEELVSREVHAVARRGEGT